MRRLALSLLVACLSAVCVPSSSATIPTTVSTGDSIFALDALYDEDVPLLIINTVDEEEPTYDEVVAPGDLWGVSITNVTKVPGSLVVMRGDSVAYDSGDYAEKTSGITIRVRGNTSAVYNIKKPYRIKLQTKSDLLMRGCDSCYMNKEWLLIYSAGMSLRTKVGMLVNELMGLQWTPACQHVNVVMNGTYRGVYLLMEAVERGCSRLQVDKTGFVMENDAYWWNEDVYVESNLSPYVNYTFKYPDNLTLAQAEYIKAAIDRMEASLDNATYTKYIDVESFANWLLAHDLLGTKDSGGSNMFLTKWDNTDASKFMMANLWDFDMIEEEPMTEWSAIHRDPNAFYYPKLLGSSDNTFTKRYAERWKEVSETIVLKINDELERFAISPLAASLDRYYVIDSIASRWESDSMREEVDRHKEWFTGRKQWLDEAVDELYHATVIKTIRYDDADNTNTYNLHGQKVDDSYRGLVIRNGKKFVLRSK